MLEVQVTRTVKLGGQVQMFPSYGYAGVDSGPAKVIGIMHDPTEGNWTMLDGYEHCVVEADESKEAFIDAHLSMINIHIEADEYEKAQRELSSEPWVAYKYLHDSEAEVYVFPLNLFIAHSGSQL